MELDDASWAAYMEAEACDSEEAMRLIHPYHHKATLMYQLHWAQLGASERADFLGQHTQARERLYASTCLIRPASREAAEAASEGVPHPLLAAAVEAVAVAMLVSGSPTDAARTFGEAAGRYADFYGSTSIDAARCRDAASTTCLEQSNLPSAWRLAEAYPLPVEAHVAL